MANSERRAVIVGTGRELGEGEFSNEDVVRGCGLDPARFGPFGSGAEFEYPEGFRLHRRVLDEETCTSTLLAAAGRKALLAAGVGPEEVDLLICVTDTPDYLSPATSARVQHGLGARNAGFFDLNSACAGFTIALAMGSNFLRCSPQARHVLIAGGNLYSRYLRPGIRLRNAEQDRARAVAEAEPERRVAGPSSPSPGRRPSMMSAGASAGKGMFPIIRWSVTATPAPPASRSRSTTRASARPCGRETSCSC